ncbi:hypothetical protein B0P06_003675 [Clostridium saccharoperbutylacetonicum]|uniref:HNH nuclease domain-containing protein n=1 Tax=Clostridium saccharoperbutylacetonicum N1-4(HMT) TaxID=931276 RepID=M1MJ99_9CLOT|nr:HNH endonuclease [Clostridium saccharoperbutylacetonicum]AGF58014.1 hypothetical protein Cspa_c42610 [Clostridium saccharoperbutylacetonicum N1-4(HMT)]NRT61213.1 hypothetical protein [Clostridium saccharoperbutylacetonicum]NSB24530.1 hypothetical protein [Clostridium saccharoperbutylacetonicum]NSB43904.1 hypothetical protein [Clostridium saccharoperbutylacetonicum]
MIILFFSKNIKSRKRCLTIKTNYKTQENKYNTKGNLTEITVLKKDGSELICKIDTFDTEKVQKAGTWFAEWHKDFNNYLVQTLTTSKVNGKTVSTKVTIQSVILDVNPKVPIKHLNGNTLDNRKENLELYNRNSKNDCTKIDHYTMGIILRDKFGNHKDTALISMDDVDQVIKDGYNWVTYKKGSEIMVVANTPEGRIRLDELIMSPDETMKVHHINLNPLDNRRSNLENQPL